MEQFELLRRRIFVAKAERVDTTQLELEFETTKKKLDAPSAQIGAVERETLASADPSGDDVGSRPSGKPPAKQKAKPKGRRNLADADHLPQVSVITGSRVRSVKTAAA
jgi:transposase